MNVYQGAISVRDKYGRRIAVPARLTHLHSCNHYDGCWLFPEAALKEPCRKCLRKPGAFRPDVAR